MSVPSAGPSGPQMWVRGPTAQQPTGEQTAPVSAGAPQEVAEGAPHAQQTEVRDSPTMVMRSVPAEGPGVAHPGQPRPQQQGRPQRPGGPGNNGRCPAKASAGSRRTAVPAPAPSRRCSAALISGAVGRRVPGRTGPKAMLVARTHADGMRAASRALGALREGRHQGHGAGGPGARRRRARAPPHLASAPGAGTAIRRTSATRPVDPRLAHGQAGEGPAQGSFPTGRPGRDQARRGG